MGPAKSTGLDHSGFPGTPECGEGLAPQTGFISKWKVKQKGKQENPSPPLLLNNQRMTGVALGP